MSNFEVPSIPKIFVPQSLPNNTESQTQSSVNASKGSLKSSNNENVVQSKESNSSKNSLAQNTNNETKAENSSPPPLPPPPQLCASCSQILLSYFVPLQQYVNDVVQIARGERQVTVPLQLTAPNTNLLIGKTDQKNEKIDFDNSSNHYSNRESEHFDHSSQDNRQVVHSYSSNQSNAFNWNQSNDYNKNQNRNYSQNVDYSQNQNQNQNRNQNLNCNENQRNQSYNESNNQQNVNHNQNPNQLSEQENKWKSSESDGKQHFIPQNNSHKSPTNETQRIESISSGEQQSQESNVNESVSHINSSEQLDDYSNNKKEESAKEREQTVWKEERPDSGLSNSTQSQSYCRDTTAEYEEESIGVSSPYAFVTIAYNNLSATNAIILANSLILTNNKSMNYTDSNGNKSLIQIPFIILIGGSIDPVLKDVIYMLFDEVISQPMDVKVALLSDQSFGIQQYKLQLWKELQSYDKCLYLESSTLVVGKVTNLFEECQELSACVDWLFPDNFNCSVFVFEPNLQTYDQIISFAIFHQKCSAQKDEGMGETLDEMTLLNQFFAPKWKKISFIYNFVKNDAIYTQIPAFMKYGDSIRIVNFGHMMSQSGGLGSMGNNPMGMGSVQPWHILFDLVASSQQDVLTGMSIDNYCKFYLNCFIQRLWPILQNTLTPLLVSKYGIGRREWSIFDLIRLLTRESGIETDDHMFTQTPITFRRIKSPAEKMSKYDNLSIEDVDQNITEKISALGLGESESVSKQVDSEPQNGNEEQTEDTNDGEKTEDKAMAKTPEETVEPLSAQQQDERSKREFEAGRIDWMGVHQSDKIIDRLKKLIRND